MPPDSHLEPSLKSPSRGAPVNGQRDSISFGGGGNTAVGERQRIRKRETKTSGAGNVDELTASLIESQGQPLISEQEKAKIRDTAWKPQGSNVPQLDSIELGYHEAWDIGKKGCVGVKVSGDWNVFGVEVASKLRFFVMDGTDTKRFLSLYNKPGAVIAKVNEKPGLMSTFTVNELRDAEWVYPKKIVIYRKARTKEKTKDKTGKEDRKVKSVLQSLPAQFYHAVLICVWEHQIHKAEQALKRQRLEERRAKGASQDKRQTVAVPRRMSRAVAPYIITAFSPKAPSGKP